jgi:two-component sensor histidine kinase
MKIITRLVIQFVGIFLLSALTCHKAIAEPMEPSPAKDSINKIINEINKSKADKNLVNNLLIIARYYLYDGDKQCEKYIDRALSLSKKLSYNDGLIRSMCLKAAFLKNISNDNVSANIVVDKAILLSKNIKRPELEAYAYYTKGLWFRWINSSITAETEEYCIKARDLYKNSGNKINEAYMIKCLADIHIGQNKPTQSLKELFEALELYKSDGHLTLHYTYDLIGLVHTSIGNYEEALKYSLLALKSAQKTKDTNDLALFYFRVGYIFMGLNQYDEALPYFKKVGQYDSSKFIQRAAAYNISKILFKSGKKDEALKSFKKNMALYPVKKESFESSGKESYLIDIYMWLQQYDKAEKHGLRMIEINEKNSFPEYFNFTGYIKLGDLYIAQGKFAEARKYINKAKLLKALKLKKDIMKLNLLQFKIDSASGNYLSAIKHYQIYKSINDSIFNEKKSNQIASIHIQYETEKKNQRIGTLTAENREQKAILEKRIFERNVFTGGAIMLLLLLLLSINRYQIKQKANKQLQEQRDIIKKNVEELNGLLKEKEELLQIKDKLIVEKEWLIKEVHHRVKNNLQMISTLLYSQSSYLKDKAAIAAINDSQQRIHAISLIHQKLYQSDNLQLVNMKSYVLELVDYLKESFESTHEIEFKIEVDSFEMEILKAIPLGLILNEAITNSLKYAFTKNKRKIISISLKHKEEHNVLLIIKDNGKGMPADFDPFQSNSLGINLMQGLSSQINADFSIKNENGTIILLKFEETNEAFKQVI